jgi:hypothetical protein
MPIIADDFLGTDIAKLYESWRILVISHDFTVLIGSQNCHDNFPWQALR